MKQQTLTQQKEAEKEQNYQRTKMQRELVVKRLKEQGCRITKQRMVLLDIILSGECASCKEICYKASRIDPKIGTATVYRMVNTLEQIGAISRRNFYRIDCADADDERAYTVELDDHTTQRLSVANFNSVLRAGLKACGYIDDQNVTSLIFRPSVG